MWITVAPHVRGLAILIAQANFVPTRHARSVSAALSQRMQIRHCACKCSRPVYATHVVGRGVGAPFPLALLRRRILVPLGTVSIMGKPRVHSTTQFAKGAVRARAGSMQLCRHCSALWHSNRFCPHCGRRRQMPHVKNHKSSPILLGLRRLLSILEPPFCRCRRVCLQHLLPHLPLQVSILFVHVFSQTFSTRVRRKMLPN